jgi:hypothetical protein
LTGDFIDIQYVNRRDDENGLRDETGCAGGYTAAGDCIREKTAAQLTREHREESAFALAYRFTDQTRAGESDFSSSSPVV